MAEDNTTSTVLATIGTVIWCIQLSPQIYFLYRKKNAEGFPPVFMLLWCISGVFMCLYFVLTCTWSVQHHDQQVNFYFLPIQASLLPAVSLGFRLLVDGTPTFVLALVGVGAAYVYNCLETRSWGPLYTFILGREPERPARVGGNGWFYASGKLEAPVWLKRLFREKNVPAATVPVANHGFKSTFRGEGRRLGSTVKRD